MTLGYRLPRLNVIAAVRYAVSALLVLCAGPEIVRAQAAQKSAPLPPTSHMAHRQLADTLAVLFTEDNPGSAADDVSIEKMIGEQFRKNTSMLALEIDHPGIIAHLASSLAARSAQNATAATPLLTARFTDVFINNLTAAELRDAIEFYQTSVGRKILNQPMGEESVSYIFTEVDKNRGVTNDILAKSLDRVDTSLPPGTTSAERAVLAMFNQTSAFRKMERIVPLLTAAGAEWNNRDKTQQNAETDVFVVAEMQKYMARNDKEKPNAQ